MEGSGTTGEARALRAIGVTLLGVVVSVAVSVGFGMSGPWWLRLSAGILSAVLLLAAIKAGTEQGSKGHVARVADWVTGGSGSNSEP